MADGRSRAVVSVIGRDQKGVVARVSTYLASADVNIEDIEQRVMEGLFIMTMLVDLSDCSLTLDELVTGLQAIGREINMEVKVRLAGRPPERKRVAVLVTKEPHCLDQLVRDRSSRLTRHVECHAALVPVGEIEARVPSAGHVRIVDVDERSRGGIDGLELDDAGAEVAEQCRRERPPERLGEVEHQNVVQGSAHRSSLRVRSRALRSHRAEWPRP